jgi:tRNA dimethylallyltransferase
MAFQWHKVNKETILPKIIVILGATTSGKTAYAIDLAHKIGGEIINADSMQVYKEIPVLTAQPTEEEKSGIIHHLFGCISCLEKFDVKNWIDSVAPLIKQIRLEGKHPILVGGTGMYIKSLVEGIAEVPEIDNSLRESLKLLPTETLYQKLVERDFDISQKLKPGDRQRIIRALEVILSTGISLSKWQEKSTSKFFNREEFDLIWLRRTREELYLRIDSRFKSMLKDGALLEASKLIDKRHLLPKAHGLPELISFLLGNITLAEATKLAQQHTRNYAKRQLTWFRHQIDFDRAIDL